MTRGDDKLTKPESHSTTTQIDRGLYDEVMVELKASLRTRHLSESMAPLPNAKDSLDHKADLIFNELTEYKATSLGRDGGPTTTINILSSMNRDEIEKLDAIYDKRHGHELRVDALAGGGISRPVTESLQIYLHGKDHRSTTDVFTLGVDACKMGGPEMLNAGFSGADSNIKNQFLKSGGEELVRESFKSWINPAYATDAVNIVKNAHM